MARRSKSTLGFPIFKHDRKRQSWSPKKKKQKKSALTTDMNPQPDLPPIWYEVECILAVRPEPDSGPEKGGTFYMTKFEYYAQWRGDWGRLKCTWEPESSFHPNGTRLLESFKEEVGLDIGAWGRVGAWCVKPSNMWIANECELFRRKYEHLEGNGMYGWLTTDASSKLDEGELINERRGKHKKDDLRAKFTTDIHGHSIVKKFVKI